MTDKEYEEYRKDIEKQLVKGLNELSELIDRNEIPLDYGELKLYELLSYIEDLIESFKKECVKCQSNIGKD
jgi:hypothetical protein